MLHFINRLRRNHMFMENAAHLRISRLRRSRMSIESVNRLWIQRLQRSRTLRRLNRKLVADQCEKPMSHFISRLRRSRMSIESTDILLIFRLQRSRMFKNLILQTGYNRFDAHRIWFLVSSKTFDSSGVVISLWHLLFYTHLTPPES